MYLLQILVNGLALGGLYASIAVGFSLVWGVLNVINILHGSLIILGGYLAFFAHQHWASIRFSSRPLPAFRCSSSAMRCSGLRSTA